MVDLSPNPRGSIQLGRPFGVPLRVQVSGLLASFVVNFLFLAVVCRLLDRGLEPREMIVAGFGATVLLHLSAVAHEYGHLVVGLRARQPVVALVLNVIGGYIVVDGRDEAAIDPLGLALSIAAGPLVSLALCLSCAGAAELLRATAPLAALAFTVGALCNAGLLVLNLLPFGMFDGGRLLRMGLVAWRARSVAPALD